MHIGCQSNNSLATVCARRYLSRRTVNICWGSHVTHGSPSARTALTVPTGEDGPSSVETRRRLQFSPQSLYDVVLVVQFSSRPLYDVTILQTSYKGSGYHSLPVLLHKGPERKLPFVPLWLIKNNTSSLGKPTILSSIYTHSIRLTTYYRKYHNCEF